MTKATESGDPTDPAEPTGPADPADPTSELERPSDNDSGPGGAIGATLRALTVDDWRQSLLLPALALVSALALSALVVIASDIDNLERIGSEPGSAISTMLTDILDAFWALLRGSVGSLRAISETLTNATPFIIVGLGLGVGFRAGLFNIGGQGQMIIGGLAATWVGFTLDAPGFIVIPIAIAAGALAGALYGAVPGYLKARNGAHEVIVTIMLNNIAILGLTWVLKTNVFQAENRVDPISKPVGADSRLPRLFGFLDRSGVRVHIGLFIALALAAFVWWLLFHSTLGYQFRAVGKSPSASKYAGMNVTVLTVLVMAVSGALAGIGGANEILGVQGRAAPGFAGSVGFDAISVSLLGRNHPAGIVAAGLLFGALKAGGQEMQAATDVPVDMIQIVQALIIIFIAAPALIRAVYRIRLAPEAQGGLVA